MRIIKNLDDSRTKYGDTNTIFRLNLLNNEELVDTTNKTLRLNIANESGLVLSKEIKTDFSGYIELDFSDPDLQKLTPDHYLLEYEYTLPDGDVAKYPTTGGLAFTITSNLKETNGSLVSNITFDEVLTAVDEKIAVYLATVQKGDKGDTGDTGATGQNGKDGKDGDVLSTKDNVFSGKNTFNQQIVGSLASRAINFDDITSVTNDMVNKSGYWVSYNKKVVGLPVDTGYFNLEVIAGDVSTAGTIYFNSFGQNRGFVGFVSNGVVKKWLELDDKSSLVHTTGNETVKGVKTFESPIVGSIAINTTLKTTTMVDLVKQAIAIYGNGFTKNLIISNAGITDSPSTYQFSVLIEINIRDNGRGYVKLTDGSGDVYIGAYANDKFDGVFTKQARDSNVVHNTGNETVAGDKVLTGKTTIANKEMTDSGWLDIPLDSGVTAVYAKYRILFGVVYIHVQQISGKAVFTPYFTLPDGIRPPDMIYQTWYAGGKFGNNQLQPDGKFMCASGGSDASTTVSFYTQYPI